MSDSRSSAWWLALNTALAYGAFRLLWWLGGLGNLLAVALVAGGLIYRAIESAHERRD